MNYLISKSFENGEIKMKFKNAVILCLIIAIFGAGCFKQENAVKNVKSGHSTEKPVGSEFLSDGKNTQSEFEKTLDQAREKFYKQDFSLASEILENYLKTSAGRPDEELNHFIAISTIGSIYLRHKKDPASLIRLFETLDKNLRLSEMEQDILSAWVGATKEWIDDERTQKKNFGPDELFSLGKKYFKRGQDKSKFLADKTGFADFQIAATYFIPFMRKHDSDPRIQEVLLYLGEIRMRSWPDNKYWSENHYLSEAIRRHPSSEFGKKAFKLLKDDVTFGYSGSGGTHVPVSWVALLNEFEKLTKAPVHKKQKHKLY
jgi:hypothetical protein